MLRSHLKPRQCERCCAFRAGDNGQISAHLRSGNCEKAVFVPMDPEVERKGNELSRSGCSKTWEQVCMVLFDCDLDDVPSPCKHCPRFLSSSLLLPLGREPY